MLAMGTSAAFPRFALGGQHLVAEQVPYLAHGAAELGLGLELVN